MNKLDGIDFERYLSECVAPDESAFIAPAAQWREDLDALFDNPETDDGDPLPWESTTDMVKLRPGEVSLWGGYNGHLKSTFTAMVAGWLMRRVRVCVASMEMEVRRTLEIMAKQASGMEKPDKEWRDRMFYPVIEQNLWMYDQMDEVEGIRILGMIEYAAKELCCRHVFIDSKMMLGLAEDGNGWLSAEKEFMQRLVWSARRTQAHIHLIVHVRKPEHGRTDKVPSKYDISGGASWSNLAHNVFLCWRNEKREDLVRKNAPIDDISEAGPAYLLNVDKQRHGKFRGMIGFHYHEQSRQFTRQPGRLIRWASHIQQTQESIRKFHERNQ